MSLRSPPTLSWYLCLSLRAALRRFAHTLAHGQQLLLGVRSAVNEVRHFLEVSDLGDGRGLLNKIHLLSG